MEGEGERIESSRLASATKFEASLGYIISRVKRRTAKKGMPIRSRHFKMLKEWQYLLFMMFFLLVPGFTHETTGVVVLP